MIAHRLDTIIDADAVLVLAQGKVVESGPPAELLQVADGAFSAMVRQTGTYQAQRLHDMAQRAAAI